MPIFKELNLLKVEDIHKLALLKFYFDYSKKNLPISLQMLPMTTHAQTHEHNTRNSCALKKPKIKYDIAKHALIYAIPQLINKTPCNIIEKI